MIAGQRGRQSTPLPVLGCQADPAWFENFSNRAHQVVPKTAGLVLRQAIGIVYVTTGYLPKELQISTKDQELRQTFLRQYGAKVVSELSAEGQLDADSATEGINLSPTNLKSIRLVRRRAGSPLSLYVRVVDQQPPTQQGHDMYQIEGEQSAFEQHYQVRPGTPDTKEPPEHNAFIGTLEKSIQARVLIDLIKGLEPPVPFLGIGLWDIAH